MIDEKIKFLIAYIINIKSDYKYLDIINNTWWNVKFNINW